ncbi:MAG TPA: fibronectin type III domain-containing protein [Patescibacteria group bacterium]|nr:fibronectin type III domain-containing protein [Patescibacteria group bacterium]
MRKSIWDKRIPTLLGILLITIGVALTSSLVKQGIIFITKASPTNVPKNVKITNSTDSSFTVSYTTDDKVIGSVNLGEDANLGQVMRDDRDQKSGELTSVKLHNITVRNLKPETNYFFTITSGQDTFSDNNQPYQVLTAPLITESPSQQEPISGKILLPDGSLAKEAIIYVTIDVAQTISTLIKSDGSYILPLNSLRASDLNSYFQFSEDIIKMLAVGENDQTSSVILSLSQINPVPSITLGKNYDFSESIEPVATDSAKFEGFPIFSNTKKASQSTEPQITTPDQDEELSDQQPLFKGIALPNEEVKIIIESEIIEDKTTADAYGNWKYRPTTPLEPGNHTVTIITKNASGILKTITRSFVVYASGTQIAEASGISPTPTIPITPTITVSETPIPLPTHISAPSPTEEPLITPISTASPTSEPTPTISINVATPTPTISSPGNPSAVTISILGIGLTLLGGFLFLLTRGSISSL